MMQDERQTQQMLLDLSFVDFAAAVVQAELVCHCPIAIVHDIEQEFKYGLQQQYRLDQWAAWMQKTLRDWLVPDQGLLLEHVAVRGLFLASSSFARSLSVSDSLLLALSLSQLSLYLERLCRFPASCTGRHAKKWYSQF